MTSGKWRPMGGVVWSVDPDPTYCTYSPPADRIHLCAPPIPPGTLWECSASCASERNDVSADCGYIWLSKTYGTLWGAQTMAIAACTSRANEYFCQLAVNPSDTPDDSPIDVIDNVTVNCMSHGSGGGGGGGGGGGDGC